MRRLSMVCGVALLSACGGGGGGSDDAIASGDHCDAVFYRELLGSYSGTLRESGSALSTPCEWATTMVLEGTHNLTCRVRATVNAVPTQLDLSGAVNYRCEAFDGAIADITGQLAATEQYLESPNYPVVLGMTIRGDQPQQDGDTLLRWPFRAQSVTTSPGELNINTGTLRKGDLP